MLPKIQKRVGFGSVCSIDIHSVEVARIAVRLSRKYTVSVRRVTTVISLAQRCTSR